MYVHLEQHSPPPPRTHELPPHNHAEFLATISQWNHFCRQSGAAVLFSLTAKNIRESNFPSTQPSHQRCFMKTNTYHSSIMCHFNDQQFCRNLYVWKKNIIYQQQLIYIRTVTSWYWIEVNLSSLSAPVQAILSARLFPSCSTDCHYPSIYPLHKTCTEFFLFTCLIKTD